MIHTRTLPFILGEQPAAWERPSASPLEGRLTITKIGGSLLSLALCFSSLLVFASALAAQIVETPQGPVEFIGLERWTPEMVLDSLAARAPDASPTQFPSALLRIGFARARADRVFDIGPSGDPAGTTRPLTIVTVVEGSHAEALQLHHPIGSAGEIPARWMAADSIFRQYNPAFLGAVSMRWLGGTGDGQTGAAPRPPTLGAPEDRAQARTALEVLGELRSPADLEAGLRLLSDDGDPEKRALAAAVLGGFPEEEAVWRTLVEALLDADANVNAFASQALGSIVAASPREVDWAPATGSLRSLIAGANLAAFPLVLQTLASTDVSPELAPALLGDNAHLVLGYMESRESPERETVHRFLVRINGQDLGASAAPWKTWIEGL